jgi:transposase-like protein
MIPISFKRHRFSPQIIQHAVWLYARFTLSFRDVEYLLAERGIDVSNETIRRWFLKFGRLVAANLRHSRPRPTSNWHLDEMVVRIRGRKHWLWRTVDDEGAVLDFLVQPRRCARSAEGLLYKLLKKQGFTPKRITTDKLKSHAVAIRTLRLSTVKEIDQQLATLEVLSANLGK